MNEKNSLGLNKCFLDLNDPFELFEKWFEEAKKKEINDPNALALGTANKKNILENLTSFSLERNF